MPSRQPALPSPVSSHIFSLPLFMAPSFSFSPHPLHLVTHTDTHICVTTVENTSYTLAYSPLLFYSLEHSQVIFPQLQRWIMPSGHFFPFQVTTYVM